jgi:dTDP-4-amino-4,6-dideoxygalactose transaminase
MIPIAKPLIGDEERALIEQVLQSGMLAQGQMVRQFENEFAHYCGVRHAIATSSGTTALYAMFMAMGLKPGDEVITTGVSFFASASQVAALGGKVIFTDVERSTYNMDASTVEALITPNTKAIMPVHLYGQPADMAELNEIGEKHGIPVVEDACQSHGAEYGGKRTGALSLAGTFSFYPTKNMTTIEGGMITTNDDPLAEKCRLLRDHGAPQHYQHSMVGFNFRMTDVSAAVGIAQLAKLDMFNTIRKQNAAYFNEQLADIDGLTLPKTKPGRSHVYHLYAPLCERKDELLKHLNDHGVGARPSYPIPIYKQKAFIDLGYGSVRCPVSEEIVPKTLLIPVHPAVSKEDCQIIVDTVKSF